MHNSYIHHTSISWIVFTLFVFLYFLSSDSLHFIDFTLFYLFIITTVFSFVLIYTLSFMYPVTVCFGKAQFPERDHLIAPSPPHTAPLSGYGILSLIRIYCPVAQWF